MGSQILQVVSQSADSVTVSQGQIPVIIFVKWTQAQEVAAKAINFLRSGCPVVQVILDNPGMKGEREIEEMRERLSDAVETLSVLKNHEEPEIEENEVFGIRPPCKTDPKQGTFGNTNYIFLVYKA
jgi:anion-transporting  ArsA/GET3 family ATPase